MATWTNSQPAPSSAPAGCPAAAAGDAMPGVRDAAELLDIDVDQFARPLALIAADRRSLAPARRSY